jgi:hypothetical protein
MSEFETRRFDLAKAKPPPTCDACGKQMWWHGSMEGWGCPGVQFGSPDCRSSLYRPKRRPTDRWPYAERYPELRRAP